MVDPRQSWTPSPDRHEHSKKRKRRHSPDSDRPGAMDSRPLDSTRHRPLYAPSKGLPYSARSLGRSDLPHYRPMFALYLDIQKGLDLEALPEDEVKGRWKSFTGKWNRGDLAEGWYDPKTLEKALASSAADQSNTDQRETHSPPRSARAIPPHNNHQDQAEDNDDDDNDAFGPALPQPSSSTALTVGPSIPNTHDLRARDEDLTSSRRTALQAAHTELTTSRASERKALASDLNNLTSRAAPGTRDRQLEKRREAAYGNRSFADGAHEGGIAEMGDADVMGDDGLGELRRMKEAEGRKKSEREIKREEMMRARKEEREERVRGMREREEKTVRMLRELARARFGGGGGGWMMVESGMVVGRVRVDRG